MGQALKPLRAQQERQGEWHLVQGSPSLPTASLEGLQVAAICVPCVITWYESCSSVGSPSPFQLEAEVNWLQTRADGASEVLLFGKPLLQNDPDEFVAFSVTQFSLP